MYCSMYGAHRIHASGGIKVYNDNMSGNNKSAKKERK